VAGLPPELFGHWIHSHEEDSGDLRVYRPAGYRFPPARGRRGFELRPDGSYVAHGPGPADKPTSRPGRGVPPRGGRGGRGRETRQNVSLEPDRLVVRPLGG
jgi:hypothetical protein